MESILKVRNIGFEVIATPRAVLQKKNADMFTNFLPAFLGLRLPKGGLAVRSLIALIYVPCIIRALGIIVSRKKPVLVSSALWFPRIDALLLAILRKLKIDFTVLVHRPYKPGIRNSISARLYFSPNNRYVCVSQYTKRYLENNYGISAGNITAFMHPNYNVVYDKIVPDPTVLNDLTRWKKTRTLFLFISGITRDHGILELSDIVEYCIRNRLEYAFLICGNPHTKSDFEIAEQLKMRFGEKEQVKMFFGYYSDEQSKAWLSVSDAVVLPYREIAQSGVQFMALGQGLPVIAKSVGALKEPIIHNWNGIVIERDSIEEWVGAFKKVRDGLAARSEIIRYSEKVCGIDRTAQAFREVFRMADAS
jgi:glycosyltransferase involved in cell wall biosynthesis